LKRLAIIHDGTRTTFHKMKGDSIKVNNMRYFFDKSFSYKQLDTEMCFFNANSEKPIAFKNKKTETAKMKSMRTKMTEFFGRIEA